MQLFRIFVNMCVTVSCRNYANNSLRVCDLCADTYVPAAAEGGASVSFGIFLFLQHSCIDLLALALGNAERFPLRTLPVLGQEDNLSRVIRQMTGSTLERL